MGTGTIATEHMVAAIRAIGHSPLWVVSRSRTDASHFSHDLDIPGATTDMKRVWGDPAVKFVYVSAPRKRRQHYIVAAANAGKHILCDGPIAEDSQTAGALVQHCLDAGVVLAMNHPLRASSVHQTMRRLISEGDIGQVQSISILRSGPYHPPPSRRGEITSERRSIYLDFCAEDVDLARFLIGGHPVEAVALAETQKGTPSQVAYSIRMQDGSLVHGQESSGTAEMESIVVVAGKEGVLIATGTLNSRGSGTHARRVDGRSELLPVRDRDLHSITLEGFLAAVTGRVSPLATGNDSVVSLKVVEAVALAVKKGRSVTV